MKVAGITLDRKILADLAVRDAATFSALGPFATQATGVVDRQLRPFTVAAQPFVRDLGPAITRLKRKSDPPERKNRETNERYAELTVAPDKLAAARALKPMYERQGFGRTVLLFDNADRAALAAVGDVRTPSIADLFVAVIGNDAQKGKLAA